MKNELKICVRSLDSKDEVIDKLKSLGFVIKDEYFANKSSDMLKRIYS